MSYPFMPGVPAAGHVTRRGFWHPGNADVCFKCESADANLYAPDGWQYGVRFADGSVAHRWNGRTQRQQAEAVVADCAVKYPNDGIHLVRRRAGRDWEPA